MVVCTKLAQWLTLAGVILGVWYVLLSRHLPVHISPELYEVILPVSLQYSQSLQILAETRHVHHFYSAIRVPYQYYVL